MIKKVPQEHNQIMEEEIEDLMMGGNAIQVSRQMKKLTQKMVDKSSTDFVDRRKEKEKVEASWFSRKSFSSLFGKIKLLDLKKMVSSLIGVKQEESIGEQIGLTEANKEPISEYKIQENSQRQQSSDTPQNNLIINYNQYNLNSRGTNCVSTQQKINCGDQVFNINDLNQKRQNNNVLRQSSDSLRSHYSESNSNHYIANNFKQNQRDAKNISSSNHFHNHHLESYSNEATRTNTGVALPHLAVTRQAIQDNSKNANYFVQKYGTVSQNQIKNVLNIEEKQPNIVQRVLVFYGNIKPQRVSQNNKRNQDSIFNPQSQILKPIPIEPYNSRPYISQHQVTYDYLNSNTFIGKKVVKETAQMQIERITKQERNKNRVNWIALDKIQKAQNTQRERILKNEEEKKLTNAIVKQAHKRISQGKPFAVIDEEESGNIEENILKEPKFNKKQKMTSEMQTSCSSDDEGDLKTFKKVKGDRNQNDLVLNGNKSNQEGDQIQNFLLQMKEDPKILDILASLIKKIQSEEGSKYDNNTNSQNQTNAQTKINSPVTEKQFHIDSVFNNSVTKNPQTNFPSLNDSILPKIQRNLFEDKIDQVSQQTFQNVPLQKTIQNTPPQTIIQVDKNKTEVVTSPKESKNSLPNDLFTFNKRIESDKFQVIKIEEDSKQEQYQKQVKDEKVNLFQSDKNNLFQQGNNNNIFKNDKLNIFAKNPKETLTEQPASNQQASIFSSGNNIFAPKAPSEAIKNVAMSIFSKESDKKQKAEVDAKVEPIQEKKEIQGESQKKEIAIQPVNQDILVAHKDKLEESNILLGNNTLKGDSSEKQQDIQIYENKQNIAETVIVQSDEQKQASSQNVSNIQPVVSEQANTLPNTNSTQVASSNEVNITPVLPEITVNHSQQQTNIPKIEVKRIESENLFALKDNNNIFGSAVNPFSQVKNPFEQKIIPQPVVVEQPKNLFSPNQNIFEMSTNPFSQDLVNKNNSTQPNNAVQPPTQPFSLDQLIAQNQSKNIFATGNSQSNNNTNQGYSSGNNSTTLLNQNTSQMNLWNQGVNSNNNLSGNFSNISSSNTPTTTSNHQINNNNLFSTNNNNNNLFKPNNNISNVFSQVAPPITNTNTPLFSNNNSSTMGISIFPSNQSNQSFNPVNPFQNNNNNNNKNNNNLQVPNYYGANNNNGNNNNLNNSFNQNNVSFQNQNMFNDSNGIETPIWNNNQYARNQSSNDQNSMGIENTLFTNNQGTNFNRNNQQTFPTQNNAQNTYFQQTSVYANNNQNPSYNQYNNPNNNMNNNNNNNMGQYNSYNQQSDFMSNNQGASSLFSNVQGANKKLILSNSNSNTNNNLNNNMNNNGNNNGPQIIVPQAQPQQVNSLFSNTNDNKTKAQVKRVETSSRASKLIGSNNPQVRIH